MYVESAYGRTGRYVHAVVCLVYVGECVGNKQSAVWHPPHHIDLVGPLVAGMRVKQLDSRVVVLYGEAYCAVKFVGNPYIFIPVHAHVYDEIRRNKARVMAYVASGLRLAVINGYAASVCRHPYKVVLP